MRFSVDFNWSPGSARVSVGEITVKDKDVEFRVGVVQESETDKIYWVKPGWFSGEPEEEIKFDVKRGDRVVVERRSKGDEKPMTRNIWDIASEWPAEAHGPSFTHVPWYL